MELMTRGTTMTKRVRRKISPRNLTATPASGMRPPKNVPRRIPTKMARSKRFGLVGVIRVEEVSSFRFQVKRQKKSTLNVTL
jgi:hypothetical protein